MSELNNDQVNNDRVVTDSVHERLRERMSVFCQECKIDIVSSLTEIEKHFNINHPSSSKCAYCHEKVYHYILKQKETSGNESITEKVFHRCEHGSS